MSDMAQLRTYVINLPRRRDRRTWIARSLPSGLPVTYSSDLPGEFDGQRLDSNVIAASGYKLFPWQTESANPWWNRPLKCGEIGCTLAHLACWRHAVANSEPYAIFLEDDAVVRPTFLNDVLAGLQQLRRNQVRFDILYLGRDPLEPDVASISGFVSPGYSHCTFGYLATREALAFMLATRLDQAIVPIDEFIPSMYIDHPRPDLRARFSRRLRALAFDPALVGQRPKREAGSDTEQSAFVQ